MHERENVNDIMRKRNKAFVLVLFAVACMGTLSVYSRTSGCTITEAIMIITFSHTVAQTAPPRPRRMGLNAKQTGLHRGAETALQQRRPALLLPLSSEAARCSWNKTFRMYGCISPLIFSF